MDPQPLAPEVEADIELALSELDRSVLEARLHDDPLRLPLSALASFLRAQRRLYADAVVSMQRNIEAGRQPVRDDELRRAVTRGIGAHAENLVRALNLRTALMGAGIVVAAIAIGFGAGRWSVGVPVSAQITNCAPAPQAGGGEAFSCTFWTHPPTQAQR